MAPRSFSGAAQEMSASESSRSRAVAHPVDATTFKEEQTYGSSSESGSESVGGKGGVEVTDLDPLQQAEVPDNENLLVLARTAQSLRDNTEDELKLQRSSSLSADQQNPIEHPFMDNMEKALNSSTRLSIVMKVMEARIKDKELQKETELHEASMARKEAEKETKETMAQIELLKLEHEHTLLFTQSGYENSLRGLEAKLAAEKIKSAATEQRLKEAEALLLYKKDVNAELEAKVQDMESRQKELKIMKSIAERRLLGEPKRRKMAVKAALDSAEAEMSQKADSFGKMYLKSALDILKRRYPNINFSMVEIEGGLGTEDPQPSRVPPSTAQKIASKSES